MSTVQALSLFKLGRLVPFRAGGQLLVFLVQVVLARNMTANDYGVFSLAYSWFIILMVIGRFGCDAAIIRFVGEYSATGEQKKMGRYLGWLILSGFALGILTGILAIAIYFSQAYLFGPESDLSGLVAFSLACIPFIFFSQSVSILRAHGFSSLYFVMGEWVYPSVFLIFILIWLASGQSQLDGLSGSALAAVSILFSAGAAIFVVFRRVPALKSVSFSVSDMKYWGSVSGVLMLTTGGMIVLDRIDIIMVGSILGAEAAAQISVASRVGALTLVGLTIANVVAGPIIAKAFYDVKGEGKKQLDGVLVKTAISGTAVGMVLFLIFLAGGEYILQLFGSQYSSLKPILLIYAGGAVLYSAIGSSPLCLAVFGAERAYLKWIGIAIFLDIVLNIILVKSIGLPGAALATVSSLLFVRLAASAVIYHRWTIATWIYNPFSSR